MTFLFQNIDSHQILIFSQNNLYVKHLYYIKKKLLIFKTNKILHSNADKNNFSSYNLF
jgi:hypothetical protein